MSPSLNKVLLFYYYLTITKSPIGGQGKGVDPPPVNSNSANNGYIKSSYFTSRNSVTRLGILPVRVKAKGHGKMVETYKPFTKAELQRN